MRNCRTDVAGVRSGPFPSRGVSLSDPESSRGSLAVASNRTLSQKFVRWLGRGRRRRAFRHTLDGSGGDPDWVQSVPRPPASTRPIRAWWWRASPRQTNFGDELGWLLLEKITGRRVERTALARCDIVSVGSLLETVLRHGGSNRPVVWGSGFLQPGDSVSADALTCAAVRGRLTRARIVGGERLALGDPGLLVNGLVERPPPRRDRIGFIPHRHDRALDSVRAFAERPEVDLLDVHAHPLEVVRAIASCRFVLSSSLHGLIVADACGVPSGWVEPSSQVEGAGYKFHDYYSVFDMEPPRVSLADWPSTPWPWVEEREATWARPGIDDLRTGLLDALRGSGT